VKTAARRRREAAPQGRACEPAGEQMFKVEPYNSPTLSNKLNSDTTKPLTARF